MTNKSYRTPFPGFALHRLQKPEILLTEIEITVNARMQSSLKIFIRSVINSKKSVNTYFYIADVIYLIMGF